MELPDVSIFTYFAGTVNFLQKRPSWLKGMGKRPSVSNLVLDKETDFVIQSNFPVFSSIPHFALFWASISKSRMSLVWIVQSLLEVGKGLLLDCTEGASFSNYFLSLPHPCLLLCPIIESFRILQRSTCSQSLKAFRFGLLSLWETLPPSAFYIHILWYLSISVKMEF